MTNPNKSASDGCNPGIPAATQTHGKSRAKQATVRREARADMGEDIVKSSRPESESQETSTVPAKNTRFEIVNGEKGRWRLRKRHQGRKQQKAADVGIMGLQDGCEVERPK